MLFTSINFAIFLFVVFVLYWSIFNQKLVIQNVFLLISSYIFYGWWDWRFLFLLFFISISNYSIGIGIQNKEKKQLRKVLFITGLIINIGTLVAFKYFNFFVDGFVNMISFFGYEINPFSLNIILPLGISFYIFLSLSYLIDIYQDKLLPVKNFISVLLTFSFFPIILSGPIHRPIGLLPQIQSRRVFNYLQATDGLRQILWGVFMKIVIADNCSEYVNIIFKGSQTYGGSTLLLGVFLFTIQIYADFAGYSNIAIGIGKLLGFNIMQNFNYPYFSRDIKEFWKRWNISLTTWLRDYIFLPIAYSLTRNIKTDRLLFIKKDIFIYSISIFITWIISGLWHGANYTFLIWGFLQGLLLLINHILSKPKKRMLRRINIRYDNVLLIIFDSIATFTIVMISWVFFKSETAEQAASYLSGIFSASLFATPEIIPGFIIILIVLFMIAEWLGRKKEYALAGLTIKLPKTIRWTLYYCIIINILYYSSTERQFIYFQF